MSKTKTPAKKIKSDANAAPEVRLPGQWDSRIVGHDRVAPDQLLANPLNFRTHPMAQREALKDAITEIGFIRSVTVNKRTGNIVDGHERVWQALTSEQPWIDVEYIDLSEKEEKKALASMDPISEMATIDNGKLDELLRDIETGSEALSELFSDMYEGVEHELEQSAGLDSERNDGRNELMKKAASKFRPVITVEEVAILEQAIRLTKKPCRGEAVAEICRAYLEKR